METNFTQGGFNNFTPGPNAPSVAYNRSGYYGWMGLGGSVLQWHPELKIGFAYTPSFLQLTDLMNLRGSYLQAVVVECAKKQSKV